MEYGVLIFDSTQHAIRAEKFLRDSGFEITTMPVPRHISSDCGIALRVDFRDRERLLEALTSNNILFAGIHKL